LYFNFDKQTDVAEMIFSGTPDFSVFNFYAWCASVAIQELFFRGMPVVGHGKFSPGSVVEAKRQI